MNAPRSTDRGLWTVALVAFFGVALGALVVDHVLKGDLASLTSLTTMPFVGLYFLLFALPSGLPALLLGRSFAARLLGRARRESLVTWSLRGVATGVLLGALGVCCWFGLLNIATPADFLREAPELAISGACCGGTVGLTVGAWCWRASRASALPPLPC